MSTTKSRTDFFFLYRAWSVWPGCPAALRLIVQTPPPSLSLSHTHTHTHTPLQTFPLLLPGASTSSRHESPLAAKGGTMWSRMVSGNLAIFGIFYMPQIYDMGLTALLPLRRKACRGFFSPLKIRRLWV
jgi:hypothetical protein